ncbi:hypothetical protein EDC04DRAFT_2650996 [Pisolithus marmoratus]|nr:hypothetical protein EDC04DRAFT_2650996 [Pisolithus marmoratus]
MRMHRPTAIFGSDPQALARISPSRAKDYLRSFITTVADGVPKFPALGLSIEEVNEASLMLDIIEREDITLRQLQSVSKQVADIATTIQRQHTNVTFTAEILSLIVEVIQNHAPSVIADVFKAWTRSSHFPPSSAHTSPRKSGMSPDSAEFSARIDPFGEPHSAPALPPEDSLPPLSHRNDTGLHCPLSSSLPPSDRWSSSSLHEVPPSPPPTTTSNSPLNDEDTWRIPSDWDALGGGSRKLRREGAFRHKPDWDAMSTTYGRGDDVAEDNHSDPRTTNDGHISTTTSSTPRGRTHRYESRGHASPPPTHHPASDSGSQLTTNVEDDPALQRRSDSPDATELRRRADELRAYLDAGYEGRLPPYQNKMKERKDVSGSHVATSPNPDVPATLPSPTPTTPRKKRPRTHSQSSSCPPFHSPSGPHVDTPSPPQDGDDSADPRTVKRMRVSASSSTPGPAVPPVPRNTPASYHMPEQTLTPEVSAKASGVNSGARSRTLPRRRPLTRAATMAHFD